MDLFLTLPPKSATVVDLPGGNVPRSLTQAVQSRISRLLATDACVVRCVPWLPKLRSLVAFPYWPTGFTFPDTVWHRLPTNIIQDAMTYALWNLTGPSAVADETASALNAMMEALHRPRRPSVDPQVDSWRGMLRPSVRQLGHGVARVSSTAWHQEYVVAKRSGLDIRTTATDDDLTNLCVAPSSRNPRSSLTVRHHFAGQSHGGTRDRALEDGDRLVGIPEE